MTASQDLDREQTQEVPLQPQPRQDNVYRDRSCPQPGGEVVQDLVPEPAREDEVAPQSQADEESEDRETRCIWVRVKQWLWFLITFVTLDCVTP